MQLLNFDFVPMLPSIRMLPRDRAKFMAPDGPEKRNKPFFL